MLLNRGRKGFGNASGGGGGGSGTALSASELERTSGVTAYPVTATFTRPIDWADDPVMYGVMQISADPTFATGVTETTLQILAATTAYDFNLDTIVTPQVRYFRLAAYTGTRPGTLNWSNICGVGDAVAPVITSDATPDGFQYVGDTLAITADKLGYLTIVGGADQAQFTLDGTDLNYATQTVAGTITVQLQWTSYFGVPSTVQNLVLTIATNSADAFSFTDVTGATQSTQYTSNTITVAGIDGGISIPVTITGGEYSKNGGAYTSAATTAVNDDTFAVRQTSSASYSTTTNTVLTIGTTSDTYSVAVMADPSVASFSLEYTSPELSGGFGPSVTQTNVTLTPGEYDFVVAHTWNRPTGVTWNGISATLAAQSVATTESRASIASYRLTVATGATASVVISATVTVNVLFAIVKKINSLAAPSSTSKLDNSGFGSVHTPDSSLTIPSPKGAAYAALNHNGNSATWDAGTELLDLRTTNLALAIVANADADPTATTDSGGAQRCMVALAYDA